MQSMNGFLRRRIKNLTIRLYGTRRRALFSSLAGLLAVAALAFYLWIFIDLPSVYAIEAGLRLPSTRIFDRHGTLLYEILPPEQGRNTVITLEELPPRCAEAFIAIEDANYWSHPGVDPQGILRALWINLRGGEVLAGGSTITQQTARLLLLDPQQQAERSLRRKLREMVLAIQLQNATSKEHVLALYLNQVYFGNLAYGIEAAARTYFHKSAHDLSLAECSLLAGIVQNGAFYDPLNNYEGARARQRVALRRMSEEGYITPAEAQMLEADDLQIGSTPFPIEAPHFVMAVWKQLERRFPDQLYGGGLDVITTLDLNWQRSAERIARQQLAALNDPANPRRRAPAEAENAAVIALHPFTGEVLTMLGSPDYFNEAIDGAVNATLALRQPGSTLKPFTYALAMDPSREHPYTAATMLFDVHTPFVTRRLESYAPANYGLAEHGPVSLREALASSYNIPAVAALDYAGLGPFKQFMADLGLEELASNDRVDLSITLGGGEVRLLDLAAAYAAFPNGGYRITPTLLLEVKERASGADLYRWEAPPLEQRVLDERVAYLISDILSDNEARIPSFGRNSALQVGRPAAAKTGTTTDFRDNWVVGYTPDLVIGVWVGNADNAPMVDVSGITGAGPIYHLFLRDVLKDVPRRAFVEPPGIVRREVCAISGLLPTPECTQRKIERFIAGTEPTEYDNMHQVFAIDRRTGYLADESTPTEYRVRQTFIVLPQEARDWGIRMGIAQPPPGALIARPDEGRGLRLLAPDPYTIFEISPILPRETQRLRLSVGAEPGTARVRYYLNEDLLGSAEADPWALWWTLELGDFTLVAEAEMADGSRQRSAPVLFRVVQDSDAAILDVAPGQRLQSASEP